MLFQMFSVLVLFFGELVQTSTAFAPPRPFRVQTRAKKPNCVGFSPTYLSSQTDLDVNSDHDEKEADLLDEMLCPELLRIEAGRGSEAEDGRILDPKFEHLAQYVKEWSASFEGNRKGSGLTTPVVVRDSREGPSVLDGIVARDGVRLLFQTTKTGDRYKSATEEKEEEKEWSSATDVKKTPAKAPVSPKARKEGGVEVLVEKTIDGDLRVRACRCNMDEKTVVKEMSEEVIVRNLKRAVKAWVGAREVTGF
eukprot:CCRYP_012853-RA/>CCRYP_012853-RA protein AED:0.39 eAED:0.39 QI:0/-1/0/1/-1/1/1/0/251